MTETALSPARAVAGGRRVGSAGRALLLVRAQATRHRLAAASRRRPMATALHVLVLVPVFGLLLLGLFAALHAGFDSAETAEEARAGLSTLLALVAIGALVGTSTAALQSLYLASDLPFLVSLPIPRRVLYGAKLTEAMSGALPAGVLLVVALAAFGTARAERPIFVVVALAVGFSLLLIATSLSVLLVAAVTRYVPPRRARLFVVAICLLVAALSWTAWSALAPAQSGTAEGGMAFATSGAGRLLSFTPLGWAAAALSASAGGDGLRFQLFASLYAASAVGISLSAYAVFARTHDRGFARLWAGSAVRPRRPLARWAARVVEPLPAGLGALILKEWLTMFRDFRRLSGAAWPLGMVVVYTVALSRENRDPDGPLGLRFWIQHGSLALLPWGASLGVSIYAFGTERRNIHLLRTLPLSPARLFFGKTLAALAPVLLLSELAAVLVATVQGGTARQVVALAALVAWAAIGYVTIDTAAAAIAPNFQADHIQRSTTLVGRTYGLLAGVLFGGLTALAAGRLILYDNYGRDVPSGLEPALSWRVWGVAPLGWPLVLAATAGALLVVLAAALGAAGRLRALLREGE